MQELDPSQTQSEFQYSRRTVATCTPAAVASTGSTAPVATSAGPPGWVGRCSRSCGSLAGADVGSVVCAGRVWVVASGGRMRRQPKGGRGVHARTHHTRPWWETDKSHINPATGGSELGTGGEINANAATSTAVAASGDGGSGGIAPGGGSAPRPQQSPSDQQRQDGRYSHKERHADQAPADRRRDQIGRTPPHASSSNVGMRTQAFSPSRVQAPACVPPAHTDTHTRRRHAHARTRALRPLLMTLTRIVSCTAVCKKQQTALPRSTRSRDRAYVKL
jgi:hypothetical protein